MIDFLSLCRFRGYRLHIPDTDPKIISIKLQFMVIHLKIDLLSWLLFPQAGADQRWNQGGGANHKSRPGVIWASGCVHLIVLGGGHLYQVLQEVDRTGLDSRSKLSYVVRPRISTQADMSPRFFSAIWRPRKYLYLDILN